MSNKSETIGTAEAASILGWSRTKVKIEAQNERLPIAGKLPGDTGAYLFNRSAIEYIAAQHDGSTSIVDLVGAPTAADQ